MTLESRIDAATKALNGLLEQAFRYGPPCRLLVDSPHIRRVFDVHPPYTSREPTDRLCGVPVRRIIHALGELVLIDDEAEATALAKIAEGLRHDPPLLREGDFPDELAILANALDA